MDYMLLHFLLNQSHFSKDKLNKGISVRALSDREFKVRPLCEEVREVEINLDLSQVGMTGSTA